MVGVYTSFLTVYIGALLMLDAQQTQGQDSTRTIVPWQVAALSTLLFIASPSIPGIFGTNIQPTAPTEAQYALVLDILLGAVGFVSVVLGVKERCSSKASLAIAVIVTGYESAGVAFGFEYVPQLMPNAQPRISPYYAYFFSIAKLAYTASLCWLIAYYGMPEEDREEGVLHWILMFLTFQTSIAPPLQLLDSRGEAVLAQGEKDTAAFAAALKISEDSARNLLVRLAASGKATLSARPLQHVSSSPLAPGDAK